jgi:uncharacterized tellurite resistance protein B-like protein
MNQIRDNYDSLIYRVKNQENTNDYDALFYNLMECDESYQTDSVMYYSKIMAEKYNYDNAYYHYLEALCRKNNIDYSDFSTIDLTKLDKPERKQILEWLQKMLEKGIITKHEYEQVKK